MLKKVEGTMETLKHTCKHNVKKIDIFLNDIHSYMMIDGEIVNIKVCPFCGIDPDSEVRP